jgi:hypothetical protein
VIALDFMTRVSELELGSPSKIRSITLAHNAKSVEDVLAEVGMFMCGRQCGNTSLNEKIILVKLCKE